MTSLDRALASFAVVSLFLAGCSSTTTREGPPTGEVTFHVQHELDDGDQGTVLLCGGCDDPAHLMKVRPLKLGGERGSSVAVLASWSCGPATPPAEAP